MQSTTVRQTNSPSVLDRSLGALVRVNWETLAWALLMILAVVSRFYDIGARAMSHDESLHAVYSYELYRTGNYTHNPMMHGPFLFHANALIYFLFGVTDATTRIIPALTGLGAIGMIWAFRRWIGRTGALVVGLLFLISPSILFHSRYIRNDIYIVFFGFIWVYGMFRYLEQRENRWLYMTAMGMALGFIAKEVQFMSGALFGAFFAAVALWRWWREKESFRHSVFADIAILMLTLVMPFTSPVGYLVGERLLGWEHVDWQAFAPTNPMLIRFGILVALVSALAAGVAYGWFAVLRAGDTRPRLTFAGWGGIMLAFWAIQVVFFTTFFTNPVNGLATGIVGSLGYWLAQQEVQRGSQPWYYYGIVTLLYEFLPMLLSIGGAVAVVRGLLKPHLGSDAGVGSARRRDESARRRSVPAHGTPHACTLCALVEHRRVAGLFLCWGEDALAAHPYGAAYGLAGRLVAGATAHPD